MMGWGDKMPSGFGSLRGCCGSDSYRRVFISCCRTSLFCGASPKRSYRFRATGEWVDAELPSLPQNITHNTEGRREKGCQTAIVQKYTSDAQVGKVCLPLSTVYSTLYIPTLHSKFQGSNQSSQAYQCLTSQSRRT
jgi:hypothetical protein